MLSESEIERVKTWIRRSLKTEKIKIDIEGTSDETDGFVADIIFAKVLLCEENEELFVVAKVGKNNEAIRKQIPIRRACEREIDFFSKIMPFFEHFQREKISRELFEAAPKCYGTFLESDSEVIIMENLRQQNFIMHKPYEPLNVDHLRLGLKNLAQFHALSFATRDQRRQEFDRLTADLQMLFRPKNPTTFFKAGTKIVQLLKKAEREDLAVAYKQFVDKGLHNIFIEVLDDVPDEKVVIHCDSHNNNILFQYQNKKQDSPCKMKILDFQHAALHSPIVDVSFFIYMGASNEEFLHFDQLISFYYNELLLAAHELGSDINALFPVSTLWRHWQKYSSYGFIMATISLEVFYIKKEDALSIRKNTGKSVLDNLSSLDNSNEAYLQRLAAIVDHYVNFKINRN